MNIWAIADNGPAAGAVFEIDEDLADVQLICDDATHHYKKYAFGCSRKSWRIARFAFVHSVVT